MIALKVVCLILRDLARFAWSSSCQAVRFVVLYVYGSMFWFAGCIGFIAAICALPAEDENAFWYHYALLCVYMPAAVFMLAIGFVLGYGSVGEPELRPHALVRGVAESAWTWASERWADYVEEAQG